METMTQEASAMTDAEARAFERVYSHYGAQTFPAHAHSFAQARADAWYKVMEKHARETGLHGYDAKGMHRLYEWADIDATVKAYQQSSLFRREHGLI